MGLIVGGFILPPADSDTINLIDISCDDNATGGGTATARIRYYADNDATRPGEVWATQSGILTDAYTLETTDGPIDPIGNTDAYQMKWESNAGFDPNLSGQSAKSTWIALDVNDFEIGWTQSGAGDRSGSVTVSLRKGTGAVLATATWDGDAVSEAKGK